MMKLIKLCLSIVMLSNINGIYGADTKTEDTQFCELKEKYQNLKFYHSDLISTIFITDDLQVVLTGKILLQHPNNWNIQIFSSKSGQLILYNCSDGVNTWVYDSKNNYILKSKSPSKIDELNINFFPSFDDYDKNTLLRKMVNGSEAEYTLSFKNKGSTFSKTNFLIDLESSLLKSMTFYDDHRKKMHIEFKNIRMNQKLSPNDFSFQNNHHLDVKVID